MPTWQFESLIWNISFRFPLTSHYDLPGLQSIFGVSQDSCVHVHLLAKMDPTEKASGYNIP